MKFIYFDVGGVLIRDFSCTKNWDLLADEWSVLKEKRNELDKMFIKFEKEANTKSNIDQFLLIMERKFGIKFPKNYSLNNTFVNRFSKNEGMKEIIKKNNNKYKLGLLTNMYPGMLDLIRKKKLIPDIDWSVIVDSSIEKYRKPEMEIYKIAQEKAKVEANEILFIDNKKENLEKAKELGWQTFWFNSSNYEQSNKELEKILR